MSQYSDKILYGKTSIPNLVSLEPLDDTCELFIQNPDGSVRSEFIKNKYWILTNQPFGLHKWVKLKGEQHYNWGLQFSSRKEFTTFRWKNKERDIYSVYDPREALMIKNGISLYHGLNAKDVTVLSYDIETTGLDGRRSDAFLILISTTFRKNGVITKRLFSYDECDNEADMIEGFAEYIRQCDPSIIVGHNIIGYDFLYILDRAKINNATFGIGRDGSEPVVDNFESKFRLDGSRDLHYKKIRIYGREICDTMFLSYNMDIGKKYESYGLKQIIKQEGLEKKDRVFYDAATIRDNYKNLVEFEKIKAYAIDDSDDALNLFDKLAPVYFNLTKMVPKVFTDIVNSASGSKLNSMMVRNYLQDGVSVAKATHIENFEGGLCFGIPGVYKSLIKLDFASLYPSIILQYKVSNKQKDPNGYLYYITKTMRDNRLVYKKLYKETGNEEYNFMDAAAKGILNSLYGFLGTPGLNYNCLESAKFITNKGRELLKQAIEYVTQDSYINFYEKNKEFIDAE